MSTIASVRLFISYRRQDAAAQAARLQDDLAERYGRQHVFRDVDSLEPGTDSARSFNQALALSDAVVVLIGPQWLSAQGPNGRRRIDDRDDLVRSQVVAALSLGKHIVPVLVGSAAMPDLYALPSDLGGLARLRPALLRDELWDTDLNRLVNALPGSERRSRSSFFHRLGQAFDVLLGRNEAQATLSAPAIGAAVQLPKTDGGTDPPQRPAKSLRYSSAIRATTSRSSMMW